MRRARLPRDLDGSANLIDLLREPLRDTEHSQVLVSLMAESHEEQRTPEPVVDLTYDPKPSLRYASAVGLQAGIVGALVSTIQNALGSHSKGASGFLTRSGGTIGFFGACSSCSLRCSGALGTYTAVSNDSGDGIHVCSHGIRCCEPEGERRCLERCRRWMCRRIPCWYQG